MGCGLTEFKGPVTGSEPFGSTKGGEFSDQLGGYQFLRKDYPLSY
jgi:hypothetical protein